VGKLLIDRNVLNQINRQKCKILNQFRIRGISLDKGLTRENYYKILDKNKQSYDERLYNNFHLNKCDK
jgi:hypothetical protein